MNRAAGFFNATIFYEIEIVFFSSRMFLYYLSMYIARTHIFLPCPRKSHVSIIICTSLLVAVFVILFIMPLKVLLNEIPKVQSYETVFYIDFHREGKMFCVGLVIYVRPKQEEWQFTYKIISSLH